MSGDVWVRASTSPVTRSMLPVMLPPVWFEPWKAMVTSFVPVSGDAADDSDSVFLGDDTSQQTLLTTPQHA
jgi:hypothetical protein